LKSLKNELNDTINNIKEESIFLDNKLKELIHLKIEESETSLKNRLETSIRIISKRLDKRVEEK
jgi:superfamily I DNA and/or RNA helicase